MKVMWQMANRSSTHILLMTRSYFQNTIGRLHQLKRTDDRVCKIFWNSYICETLERKEKKKNRRIGVEVHDETLLSEQANCRGWLEII